MKAVQWNEIKKNKPAIFDWLVFLCSISLGFIFPSLKDLVTSPSFSNWMLAGLILYIAGILLKHQPLYYRLTLSGNKPKGISYLLFLIIGHWIIMLAAIIFAEGAFRKIIGMTAVSAGSSTGIKTFITIVIAAFITWLTYRPGRKSSKPLSEKYLFARELVADILLVGGVVMLSFVFWEKSLLPAFTYAPMKSIGDICIRIILFSLAYILFYLPLRYLYLIEDHSGRQVWKRLSLIIILLLVRALFLAFGF
ncbi:MAG: hypothetical protein ABIO79_15225 [Ferruginibacter sp.]